MTSSGALMFAYGSIPDETHTQVADGAPKREAIWTQECMFPDDLAAQLSGWRRHHSKQWIEQGVAHDCWPAAEAALTRHLPEDPREAW